MNAKAQNEASQMPPDSAWLYLEECSHRTRNQYAAMLAVVRMALRDGHDTVPRAVLSNVARRLEAAAEAQSILAPSIAGKFRSLEENLSRLCAALSESTLNHASILLTLCVEPVRVTPWQCWRIQLIVAELVTNAAKHAFADAASGEIIVQVSAHGPFIRCMVADNGVGDPHAIPGAGSAVIDGLIAELNGTVARQYSYKGSAIVVLVPVDSRLERSGSL